MNSSFSVMGPLCRHLPSYELSMIVVTGVRHDLSKKDQRILDLVFLACGRILEDTRCWLLLFWHLVVSFEPSVHGSSRAN